MKLEHVPLLERLRELYAQPRGFERFREYVHTLTGGGPDMELPIAAFNPMGKEAAAASLDAWIEAGAEEAAARATEEAERRLGCLDADLRVALVLADDARGGWTNRAMTEAQERFEPRATLRRGWVVALLWTSDEARAQSARAATLAAIYRNLWVRAGGAPRSLSEMLRQEGLAAAFGDVAEPTLEAATLATVRRRIEPYLESDAYPRIIACLYGDAAAAELGYDVLSLPPRAGFSLALHEQRAAGADPVAELIAREAAGRS